ncbi:MAG: type II secretion system F family protein [Arenicellales bacterium WSBS_2016_MAG_OTU3]
MFGAGVPLVDALDSVAKSAATRCMRRRCCKLRDDVSSGSR